MKRLIPIVLGALAICGPSAFAQTARNIIERALAAAPRQMREGATVIQWKADFTYETLKKGTNRLVCYDRSGEPGRAAVRGAVHQHRQPGSGCPEPEVRGDDRQGRETGGAGCGRSERNPRKARVRIGVVRHEWPRSGARPNPHDDRRSRRHHQVHRTARQSLARRRVDHERGHLHRPHHDAGQLNRLSPSGNRLALTGGLSRVARRERLFVRP